MAFQVPKGMPESVFHDKYARKLDNGGHEAYETWEQCATRVVNGNFALATHRSVRDYSSDAAYTVKSSAYNDTLRLAIDGVLPFAGRHLQHGDGTQPSKCAELFANCSTAMFSWALFLLLMKGAGVGRDYSSGLCWTNWDNLPECRFVLAGPDNLGNGGHSDYEPWIETVEEASHKYDAESEGVRWFEVEDSAEGWAKVVMIMETAAFHAHNKDTIFVFDFSKVRKKGAPLMGQQGRPASGPVPFIKALHRVMSIKNAGMKPWKQALFIDHYLAACVVVGGVRRSARMAIKSWRDRDVIEFIDIKRGGFLWSANNSIAVDAAFWKDARSPKPSFARRVFEAAGGSSYWDNTGEPGFVNVDQLNDNTDNLDAVNADTYISEFYARRLGGIHKRTKDMFAYFLDKAKSHWYRYIPNPCFGVGTLIVTDRGAFPIEELVGKTVNVWDGSEWRTVDNFRITGQNQPMLRITMQDGSAFRVTPAHTLVLQNGEDIKAAELTVGTKLKLSDVVYHGNLDERGTYLKGFLLGDGSTRGRAYPKLALYAPKYCCMERLLKSAAEIPQSAIRTNAVAELGFTQEQHGQRLRLMQGLAPLGYELNDWVDDFRDGLPSRVFRWTERAKSEFIAGLFDADGTALDSANGFSYQLTSISRSVLEDVQTLLKSMGVRAKIGLASRGGNTEWPDGRVYESQPLYRLSLSQANAIKVASLVAFARLPSFADREVVYDMKPRAGEVAKIEEDGVDDKVYCCTVAKTHRVSLAIGLTTGQCSEVPLAIWGAYCFIGDVCLAYAKTTDDALLAARCLAAALVRVNTMPCMYEAEVRRTNRIGVSLTGIHEFAWRHFALDFHNLIGDDHWDENIGDGVEIGDAGKWVLSERAEAFWQFIERLRYYAEEAGVVEAKRYGLPSPATTTIIKPNGTVSKVLAVTEGANLPANRHYVRWVMLPKGSEEAARYEQSGYPVKDVSSQYANTVVVGFPTCLPFVNEVQDVRLVTAGDASIREHYRWLQLLEQSWLGRDRRNGQIAYTLKWRKSEVPYEEYIAAILEYQPTIRCCSLMPELEQNESAYAYVPEEPISSDEYRRLVQGIQRLEVEMYAGDELLCASGACGVDYDIHETSHGSTRTVVRPDELGW